MNYEEEWEGYEEEGEDIWGNLASSEGRKITKEANRTGEHIEQVQEDIQEHMGRVGGRRGGQ